MASTSASSTSLSAASDSFDVESDIDSETELTEESETTQNKTVVSLLHRLKSPTAADISRARKTKKNDPPRCKRHCRSALSSDPKGISPSQRVREFEQESFVVSNGHLFCSACSEQLSLKRSMIRNCIQSSKHQRSKQLLDRKEAREKDIVESLRKYNRAVVYRTMWKHHLCFNLTTDISI